MTRIIVGVFLVLHGLVHLLYLGQSARFFELQPGMTWPAGSWAFSKFLGDKAARTLASILCVLAALGFVIGTAGLLASQSWWRAAVVVPAVLSAVLYILFWNGHLQHLDHQGGVGVLLDVAILIAVLVFRWP